MVVAIECRPRAGIEGGSEKRTPLESSEEEPMVWEEAKGEKLSGPCSRAGVGSKAWVGDAERAAIDGDNLVAGQWPRRVPV